MPSSAPRRRTLGQVPSCTPAISTRSHSRPLARCAVRTATASPCGARSASESPAISCPDRLSRNSSAEPCGSRAVKRAAASNRATTASRSPSAAAPRVPPAALAACHCAVEKAFGPIRIPQELIPALVMMRDRLTAGQAQRIVSYRKILSAHQLGHIVIASDRAASRVDLPTSLRHEWAPLAELALEEGG